MLDTKLYGNNIKVFSYRTCKLLFKVPLTKTLTSKNEP